MERATIICQWTWLQAQISDLEYRIRQQTDLYKQLRANKGPVVLGGDQKPEDLMKQQGRLSSTSVVNSRRNKGLPHSSSSIQKVPSGERPCDLSSCTPSYFMNIVEKQSSRLTQSLGNPMCQSPSCTPISGSPGPPKACTSSRQVNGKINCLHTSRSNNISLASLEAEEILKKKRLDSLATVPSVPDNSCVAARIRPICRYKKRKLVRANTVSLLSKKLSSKKRKVECSYDINNIVIPMSMAAATRVEKLQYKEILTPSWRVVEPKDVEPLDHMDSELEDTSDETYLNHHTKYEELERARWDSWAAAVSHKRGNRMKKERDNRLKVLLLESALTPAPKHQSDSAPSTTASVPSMSRHRSPSTALAKKPKKTGRRKIAYFPQGKRQGWG
ncbi:hypothetical protein UY3_13300 [Chelonia mydas]|uniref:PEHE domain-containing protein n=1 Tax=Chelonia mydas TaxID=8469 RepID=M7AVR8_CHEMY|nr:hypothetical protein UY3_13300 [Chelonia mydas]